MNFHSSSDLHARRIDVTRGGGRRRRTIQERRSRNDRAWSNDKTGEHRPVPDLVDADLLAHGVTRVATRESGWRVRPSPPGGQTRSATVVPVSCEWLVPAARSRLGSWISDEGLALKNQARRRRTLAVSLSVAPTRLASLCLTLLGSLPVLACSCLLGVADTRE